MPEFFFYFFPYPSGLGRIALKRNVVVFVNIREISSICLKYNFFRNKYQEEELPILDFLTILSCCHFIENVL